MYRVNEAVPNPHCEEAAHWNAALEAYHDDRVLDAWTEIEPHGIGEAGLNIRWYRLIEAEAILRAQSTFVKASSWLTVETIVAETLGTEKQISQTALEVGDAVAQSLGWNHEAPVLLSILSKDSENPWATNPHGYWVNKEPYDKICLPFYILDDETELRRAFAHEYAHVICGGMSSEYAPTWLHEAVSVTTEMLIAGEADEDDPVPWLSPTQLSGLLDSETVEDQEQFHDGYVQCGWIGKYLLSIGGSTKISALLREHANEMVGGNLVRLFRGRKRVDIAFQRVYGLSVAQVFAKAEKFMQKSTPQT